MTRSFVAVSALAAASLLVYGCSEGPDSPLMADALLQQGRNGTSIAVVDVTANACLLDTGEAVLTGAVLVRNAGRVDTQGLEVAVRVEHADGSGPFEDVPGAQASVVAGSQIPAHGTTPVPYGLSFTPIGGASHRLAIHATITNHSGRLGTPWGPEPKRPLSLGSLPECEGPGGDGAGEDEPEGGDSGDDPPAEPVVGITEPSDGATFAQGTPITFAGTAVDGSGADISGALEWASDLDGPLGTGASVAASLGVGTHTVTASVDDGNGGSVSAAVTVSVEEAYTCELGGGVTKLWRGGSDAAWSNPANWEPSGVPSAGDRVRVCASTPFSPALGGANTVGGLLIDPGTGLGLGGWTLTVSGDVDAGGTGVAGPGLLAMTGSSTLRGLVPDLRVTGAVTASGTLAVTGDLTITGSGARIDVGGHPLAVGGDLRTSSSGVLRMTDAAGVLSVAGDAVFGAAVVAGHLTAGELRVAGELAATTNLGFRATDEHRVVLNGTVTQSVSFTQSGATSSRFQHLELANPAGVAFVSDAYAGGDLAVAGTAGPVTGAVTVSVAGDMSDPASAWEVARTTFTGSPALPALLRTNATFTGAAVLMGDVDLAGDLTVTGSGARLELGGRRLAVGGDLRAQNSGVLRMVNPADRLVVAGDATFAAAVVAGHLTAGELRVAGHFSVTTNLGFRATDGHLVVLDGSAAQSVAFAQTGPTSSRFQRLSIENPAGVSFATSAYLGGDLAVVGGAGPVTGASVVTVAGDMADPGSAWEVASTTFTGASALPATLRTHATIAGLVTPGRDVSIVGDLTVSGSGARFELGGHQVTVSGDLLTQTSGVLRMAHAADRLVVHGDATFAAAVVAGNLTAGELRVAGHFSVPASLGFRATEAHRVVLAGSALQNVAFAATGATSSRFQHLEVVNAAGARFTSNVYVSAGADVSGRMAVDADRTISIAAVLALRASATLDNLGTVRYCGGFTDEGATIIGNPPVHGC